MNTGTLPAPISRSLFAALFVLAGVFAGASAQAQEACPLPAGVTPPQGPRVTAQQVENGSASLMEFALAVRDRHTSLGLNQGARALEEAFYVQCLIRQEGSPWRSGSTYLVFLTPDGRVFEHAKAMRLSGRLLNPLIYGAILQAMGINPADLTDPAAAGAAFAAAAAGNGGSFKIPTVPGASGYAAPYLPNPQVPLVLLVGFDLDASHLVEEVIDYGDPAVTAAEVVDRATLKAFVTEAGKFFVALIEGADDPATIAKARIAARDPNGPWRHDPVYLYVFGTYQQHHLVSRSFSGRI